MRRAFVLTLCALLLGLTCYQLMQDNRWVRDLQKRLQYFHQVGNHLSDGGAVLYKDDTPAKQPESHESLQQLAHTIPAAADVWERFQAYAAVGDAERWKFRGSGYLYTTHGLILEAYMENKTIFIRNVAPGTTPKDCHRLTMWVRLEGPEIFAGRPNAVEDDGKSSCHWEYQVPQLQVAGTYRLDVKLLVWNGQVPIQLLDGAQPKIQCERKDEVLDASNPIMSLPHDGIRGFKLYDPVNSCCEICSRLPHCKHWATPPTNFSATFANNGCEFFFDSANYVIPPSKHLDPRRRRRLAAVPTAYGVPHKNPVAYFMGCGWSYWFTLDYPCLSGELDDRVFVAKPEILIKGDEPTLVKLDDKNKPLCSAADERSGTGRWVRGPTPSDCPEYKRDENFASKFGIVEFADDAPQCWHRDDLTVIGNKCIEMNCRFIPKTSLWRSRVHNETNWYGVWKPYNCDYLEFTRNELQSCIDRNQISSIKAVGKSIAEFLGEYLNQRLFGLKMYESSGSEQEGKTIVLSTLGVLHWASSSDQDLEQSAKRELENVLAKNPSATIYLVPGFFLSSERATQTHVDRMILVNSVLAKQNEVVLEAFNMSAAFTYDSATQNDGMHIIGPTMKMIITKLFHHLCSGSLDSSEGSRVGSW